MGATKPKGRQSLGFLITAVTPPLLLVSKLTFGSGYLLPNIPKAEAVKNSELYSKLKADILAAMKPKITPNNNTNKGSVNKTSNSSNTGTGSQGPR